MIFNLALLGHFIYEFYVSALEIVGTLDNSFLYSIYLFVFSLLLQLCFLFGIIKSVIVRFFVKIITFLFNLVGFGGGLFLLYSIRLNELVYKDVVFESSFFSLKRHYFRDDYLAAIKFFYEKHNGMDLYNKLVPIDFEILAQSATMAELEWKVQYHIAHPKISFFQKVYDYV
jgi:hypothetical protein